MKPQGCYICGRVEHHADWCSQGDGDKKYPLPVNHDCYQPGEDEGLEFEEQLPLTNRGD